MNRPWRITFTGIDESCPLDELRALLWLDDRIELGVLYSETQAGSGRYPVVSWVNEIALRLGAEFQSRVALHVCGRAVKSFIRGKPVQFTPWWFGRIQLNGSFDTEDSNYLRRFIGDGEAWPIITQYDNAPRLHDVIRRPGHQVLFDASGGRGIARKDWPKHLGDWYCGYAGGLGPDNLEAELPRIAAAAGNSRYWIDMEGKLRTEADQFSIEAAHDAINAIQRAEGLADQVTAEQQSAGKD